MPMERAEPTSMRQAASTSFAFRSGIFFSAISRSWSIETVPTVPLPGVGEPYGSLAACLMKKLAGGVLVTKLKVRSA